MGLGRWIAACGLVGVLAWVSTWPSFITFRLEIVLAREVSEVYQLMADLRNTQKYHPFVQGTDLLHTEISPDGIEKRTFRISDLIPLPLGFEMLHTFDVLTTLTKPNQEMRHEIEALGVKGTSIWTFKPHKGSTGDRPSTVFTEDYIMYCMWIACGFVEDRARSSHEELFHKIKEDLDGSVHKTQNS